MKWNVGTKIASGFGLALAVFIIVGAASHHAMTQLWLAAESRRHTYSVLGLLEDPLMLLRTVEHGHRSYFVTDDESFLRQARSAGEEIHATIQLLRKETVDNPRQQQRLSALEPLIAERLDFAEETLESYRAQGQKGLALQIRVSRGAELNDAIEKVISEMKAEEQSLLNERINKADRDARTAKWTILLGSALGAALAVLAAFLITREIASPLRRLTAVAERITLGDINVHVPVDARTDEVGALTRAFDRMSRSLRSMATAAEQIAQGDLHSTITPQSDDDALGQAFNRMTANLRQQIGSMVEMTHQLGVAAGQIVASTAELAATASQSAVAVAQTTATAEEVRQTALLSSQKAGLVSDSSQKALQNAQSGRKSSADVGAGMDSIRQQMDAISSSMEGLSGHSQSIGQIIATVEDLAVQSNLLAVNAAIEAAKAGEHGRGFSVVAKEVKSLSEQSRQATSQVRTILGDIQKAIASCALATERGGKVVDVGRLQTEVAGQSIQALAGSIHEAAQAATQIAASSQQQLIGVDQVASAMVSIKDASNQTLESARQLETAVRSLNDLGDRLKQIVASYRL